MNKKNILNLAILIVEYLFGLRTLIWCFEFMQESYFGFVGSIIMLIVLIGFLYIETKKYMDNKF
ncbi:hypothetical protein [Floccifex sp.]|uniref:hypothetical protein n=1 Tax=Floccifex sp. TaxID=2815810 RepID=UPI002A75652C|nr:hypothetical protein [Floccifex sp.]MDD7280516.1 hypothetical protein [Erysipelotrichaceae bacterium]MDY2958531.1 hypothetical protein [Floccifex sp.]